MLNDGKYGVNVVDNEIRLSLLKSAMMPDQNADRGTQSVTYAFYPFAGDLQSSAILREATELNEPLTLGSPERMWDPAPILMPDRGNIVVDTVKPADTVDNALLVRVYEAMGLQTDCSFAVHDRITKIQETDMLEENPADVHPDRVTFGAFEIKTFLLYF